MAAIDKLYLRDYQDYVLLKTWSMKYYPKLQKFLYDWNKKEYEEARDKWVSHCMEVYKRDFDMLGKYWNPEKECYELSRFASDKGISFVDAYEIKKEIIRKASKTRKQLEKEYGFAAMNTPFKVDKKLKWICPLPFVREYLHEQCGVNPKWEWLYKIFWRGKKEFMH